MAGKRLPPCPGDRFKMNSSGIWLRWSWRDLRKRWMQVFAIALVIALGTGTFASLSATTVWRTISADDAYATTNMFDLRVQLPEASFIPEGELSTPARQLLAEGTINGFQERLILPTQVRAQGETEEILVRGRIIGYGDSGNGEWIASPYVMAGNDLSAADTPEILLEHNFARHYKLADSGEVVVGGGTTVSYSGQAITPEFFFVVTGEGGFLEQTRFALIYTNAETAREISGAGPVVNDLLLTLPAGSDPLAAEERVRTVLEESLGNVGFTIVQKEDDEVFGAIYNDIEGDQRVFNIFSLAIVSGAVFASFNLITRMVEAQRREIGIALGLGIPPWKVAIRPLLASAQIALLGVIMGVLVGIAIGTAMHSVFVSFLPLPEWQTPFQFGLYTWVAALGFGAPFVAGIWPVWRAVRVPPVDAIRTGHLASRGGGPFTVLQKIPVPGSMLTQLPFRNILRAPRRAILTSLGVAATITILVAVVGLLDSFIETIDSGGAEIEGSTPERFTVQLDRPYPLDSPIIQTITESEVTQRAEPFILTGGTLLGDDDEFDLTIQLLDLEDGMWQPTLEQGQYQPEVQGLLIAQKAAEDLGLEPGDTVTLRHPVITPSGAFALVETDLPVSAVHPHPFRFVTYMDIRHADLFGLEGTANSVYILPAQGVTPDSVTRALFDVPGVVSTEPVTILADVFRDLMEQFIGILQVIQGVVLLLALMIAFNTSSISMDERAREHATMFAFGVTPRRVLGLAIIESGLIGVLSTGIGIIGGYFLMVWILGITEGSVSPDIQLKAVLSVGTVLTALALGALAVAIAPLLNYRKLRRMDIPSTLRVME